jgi:phosphatidylglycerol---prolipoprotein diacylglyceryl transferase
LACSCTVTAMQQILFHIPFTSSLMPPDGVPIYGFGAMLFLCFVLTAMVWGARRTVKIGLPADKFLDLVIVLFLTGIAGARALYMMQYYKDFKGKNLFVTFFQIWEGGIVFYGSIIGALLGFIVFYRLVLRKLKISVPQLTDVVAPLLALGLAIGRIGCYLNGCCWGQVMIPEVEVHPPLPVSFGQFPLIPSHSRDQLARAALDDDKMPQIHGLQTTTGFTMDRGGLVLGVEPGSSAKAAGLQVGDRIVQVNGTPYPFRTEKGDIDTVAEFVTEPRGRNRLNLQVERDRQKVDLSFYPLTMPLFPTQLYETVSMLLLILVLIAFQPFRRHNGQVMVVMMIGYAVHRFFNEGIRIEPTYAFGLTLSQWISIGILLGAVAYEIYLRKTQPKLPKGLNPLGA